LLEVVQCRGFQDVVTKRSGELGVCVDVPRGERLPEDQCPAEFLAMRGRSAGVADELRRHLTEQDRTGVEL